MLEFNDRYGRTIGLPRLPASVSDRVTLTEHVEFLWVRPEEISRYNYVPEIKILRRFPLPRRDRASGRVKE